MKRKYPLLKNEIEMIQIVLIEEVFPTKEYRLKLADNLEKLKGMWYKISNAQNRRKKNYK